MIYHLCTYLIPQSATGVNSALSNFTFLREFLRGPIYPICLCNNCLKLSNLELTESKKFASRVSQLTEKQ